VYTNIHIKKDGLCRNGYQVLTFDSRGMGRSKVSGWMLCHGMNGRRRRRRRRKEEGVAPHYYYYYHYYYYSCY